MNETELLTRILEQLSAIHALLLYAGACVVGWLLATIAIQVMIIWVERRK
jgi:hypothetical protein